MVAPKFSLFVLFVLSSCAIAQKQIEVTIENSASGCFLLSANKTELANPVLLDIKVEPNNTGDCPCKSALLKYTVIQKMEGYENFLVSGIFSPLGISKLALPLSVQSRLVVQEKPVSVKVTCAPN